MGERETDHDGNPDLALTFLKAWEDQNIEQCLELLHPDAKYTDNIGEDFAPISSPKRGHEAVRRVLETVAQYWEHLAFRPGPVYYRNGKKNEIHCRIEFLIRHRPSGELLFGTNRFIARFEDGLIKRINNIHDAAMFAAFRRVIGSMRVGLPEIREADAPADIAKLYADIKSATGTPQVNLIYRHLATIDGMLAWTWDVLGPLYRSGEISARVTRLSDQLPPVASPGILADLDPEKRAAVRNVLAFYQRGNTHNLIALTALTRAGTRDLSLPRPVLNGRADAGSLAAVPPLPKREDLDVEMLKLIRNLANRQGAAKLA